METRFGAEVIRRVPLIRLGLASSSLLTSYFVLADVLLPVSALFWWAVIHETFHYISPPLAMVLGQSRTESLILHGMLTDMIDAQVVSLLDEDTFSGSPSDRLMGLERPIRTRAGDWKGVVLEFAEIVRVIVVDARKVSSNVQWEMSLVSRPELAVRTLVILDDDTRSVAPGPVNELIRTGVKSTTMPELKSALEGVLHRRCRSFDEWIAAHPQDGGS